MKQATDQNKQMILPAYTSQQDLNSNNNDNTSSSHLSFVDLTEKPVQSLSNNHKSNKWRFILRVSQIIYVIGSFGFQVSANSWSGRNTPFKNISLLYFFYAIEWLSFIWSAFCIYVGLSIKVNKTGAGNIKPAVGFAMDTLLAALLGIGITMEIATYTCPAGEFNGWCNFYNVGLCFGMLLFLSFGISALWDLFSSLSCLRTSLNNNLV